MKPFEWILTVPLGFAWIVLALFHGRFWRAAPILKPRGGTPPHWPDVCVVIPARNEAEVLPKTLPALLSQDYPGPLKVLLVNDQSTDGTAAFASQIAADPGRKIPFQALEARTLEPGWTGKIWALEQGVRFSEKNGGSPDYFLFTDADILHHASSVRDLVAQAEGENCALVSLMVKLHCSSFWERLLIPSFVFFFQKLYPFSRVNDPKSRTAGAAGGCILIRADALKKIGGLHAIRSELIDDCSLAKKVKGSGGRVWLGLTESVQSLRVYENLGEIWNMVARTAFTQLKFSWLALAGTVFAMFWLYIFAPVLFFAGIFSGNMERIIFGGLIWAGMSLLYLPITRFYKISPLYSLSLPVISFLYTGMTVHSALRHLKGSGGRWKGRNYPSEPIS